MTWVIAFLLAVCLPLESSLAKKPPEDNPPQPPPVHYSLHMIYPPVGGDSIFSVSTEMNDAGCVVGSYLTAENQLRGFVYNHPRYANETRDLNDIVSGLPDDWHIRIALGINDPDPDGGRPFGDIVGSLFHNDSPDDDVRRAYVIDMNAAPDPALVVIELPVEFGARAVARDINNSGDIYGYFKVAEGIYEIFLYNPGLLIDAYAGNGYAPKHLDDIGPVDPDDCFINDRIDGRLQLAGISLSGDDQRTVATPYRWQIVVDSGTPLVEWSESEVLEELTDYLFVKDINHYGVVLGTAEGRVGNGNKTVRAPYQYDTEAHFFFSDDRYSPGVARSMNDEGDFVTLYRIYLEGFGYFYPDELIDPADLGVWEGNDGYLLSAINNRVGGFGQIAGSITVDGVALGFVLTPTE